MNFAKLADPTGLLKKLPSPLEALGLPDPAMQILKGMSPQERMDQGKVKEALMKSGVKEDVAAEVAKVTQQAELQAAAAGGGQQFGAQS